MKDRKQDFVDRYIRGEMDEEERGLFEKQLTEDEELNEMYKYTAKVSKAVKDRNEKIEKIKRWEAEHKTKSRAPKFHNTTAGKFVYTLLSVAAVTAIILFVNKGPSIPEIDIQKYESYRGSSSVSHVATLIKEENYDQALYVIESVEKEYQHDLDSLQQIMQTTSEDNAKRIDYEISANRVDYDELRWLKVYTFFGLDRKEDAKSLLKEISESNSVYRVEADSLLKILNN